MPELYVIPDIPLPEQLHGTYLGFALRRLSGAELVAIEDQFFRKGQERRLKEGLSTVVLPDVRLDPSVINESTVLAEFALSLLASSGHALVSMVAAFNQDMCCYVSSTSGLQTTSPQPEFVQTVNGSAAAQWLRRCSLAKERLRDRLHITASRFVRYAQSSETTEALLDLCICLESLFDSQTEIAFRFAVCLTKLLGEKGARAEQISALFSELYDLRSKVVHGDPKAAAVLRRIQPHFLTLRRLARRALTIYVLYLSEHSRQDWQSHLKTIVFA